MKARVMSVVQASASVTLCLACPSILISSISSDSTTVHAHEGGVALSGKRASRRRSSRLSCAFLGDMSVMSVPISLKELEDDPRLFLYTSLTAGSSHIITATSRMETILKANKLPFQAIDLATDEKARRLWQRRAGQRKLPGLVKEGYVVGVRDMSYAW